MSKLIQTLKKQHEEILSRFDALKKLDLSSGEAKITLREIKVLIVAHLALEDEKLYPALLEFGKSDANLKILVKNYVDEMKELSSIVINFFQKYEEQTMKGIEFSKDLGKLLGTLQQRIRREESILYKEFATRVP